VIKNNEFLLVVELPAETKTSFNELVLEAQLLYDCSPSPKDVLQVRQKPFRYKSSVDPKDTRKCCLQVSISILSSQHEDMNFLLFLEAKHSKTKEVLASGYSDPVQVISKPDVLRKKREPKQKKRTWNDRVTEMLEQIQNKQAEQEKVLKQLSANQSDPLAALFSASSKDLQSASPSQRFERAYHDLLSAYRELAPPERPTKIRKLVESNPEDTKDLVNLFSDFQTLVPYSSPPPPGFPLSPSPLVEDLDLNNLVSELFSVEGAY